MDIDPLIYVAAGLLAGLIVVAAFLGWALSHTSATLRSPKRGGGHRERD